LDDRLVAAAGGRFQAKPINQHKLPTCIPDEPILSQHCCCGIDCCSPNAEHVREKLLREWKVILTGAIVGHKHPTGTTLFHSVEPAAPVEGIRPRADAAVVADNGVGLRSDLDWRTAQSLGLRLVRTLAEQLGARLDVHSMKGTEVRLTFAAAA